MNFLHSFYYFCCLALSLVLGCNSAKTFTIAVAAPLTGDTGTEGQGIVRAVELALDEANEAKRFPFRLKVLAFDDRTNPEVAVHVANLIVANRKVLAVIGHLSSGCTIAAARIYSKAGLPMITPSASNPMVTLQQIDPTWNPRNVFRMVPMDDAQGAYAAEFFISRLKVRRLAMIHNGTAYGLGLAQEVRKRFLELGGQLLSFNQVLEGEQDFGILLDKIKASQPDAIYFSGFYPQAGLILRRMKEIRLNCIFMAGDAVKTASIFTVAGEASDGIYVSMLGVPVEHLPGARTFIEKYKARYESSRQELKPFDHLAYESAQVVLDALAKSGPEKKALLEAIRQTDREGLTGRIRFDYKGDILQRVITMTRVDWAQRKFVLVR